MFAEILLAILLGVSAGIFTGLIPGIHINLIALLLIPLTLTQNFSITSTLIFITSMATLHTFIDFIPTIFLGAPDEDTGLGVLPGHEFLLNGKGHHAILLTIIGSTIAIISLIFIIPAFIFLIPKVYPFLQKMMGFFLIWIVILLIITEKEKLPSIIIFITSGFLGLATFNLNINEPLLPLLTGLFGTSTIINSIKSKVHIPKQQISNFSIPKSELIKPTLITIFISPICSFFPGLGSSQAAVIGSKLTKNQTREQFLILLGSINTLVIAISFITLYLVQKTRTGVAFTISQITQLSNSNLITIFIAIFIATILAIPITLTLSKTIAKNIHKISYEKISKSILLFLIIIIFYFEGFIGLLILTISTCLSLTCIEFKTKRSFLMGVILIPTIIFYLPF